MKNLVNFINESADKKISEKIFNELKIYFKQNKKEYVHRPGVYNDDIDAENTELVEDLFYNILHLCLDENKFGDNASYQSWAVGIEGAFNKINDEQDWI